MIPPGCSTPRIVAPPLEASTGGIGWGRGFLSGIERGEGVGTTHSEGRIGAIPANGGGIQLDFGGSGDGVDALTGVWIRAFNDGSV